MVTTKYIVSAVFLSVLIVGVAPSEAGQRGRERVVGRAVPRAAYPVRVIAPRIVRPAIVGVVPYRPYVYRPRIGIAAFYGSPYYPYYGYYGYPYSAYAYPYGYPAYPYGYPAPPGYIAAVPGRPYGGVRIVDAPRDAPVYADGYYVGIVDDFDGVFQHMNLEAGPHRIEIRVPGEPPVVFDVNVEPGRTITYRYP